MAQVRVGILLGVALLTTSVLAERGSVLDDTLDDFLERCSKDLQEQKYFRGYYSAFLEKQSKKRRNGKGRVLRKLRVEALKNLERHHPKWYKEVEQYVFDLEEPTREARKARLFLTRFALLQEYREEKLGYNQGWWKKTKGYFKSMGAKVVDLKDRALHRNKYAKA